MPLSCTNDDNWHMLYQNATLNLHVSFGEFKVKQILINTTLGKTDADYVLIYYYNVK